MSTHSHHHHDSESCRRYLGSLSDYADGALTDELCAEIEAHMEGCENCRVVVNTLTKTILLYRQSPAPDMPDAVKERLYKVLHLEKFYRSDPTDPQGSSST
ncbi:MAG: zf-HC2 domain-containing protein [Chloroflexi bacterium]|nr:zf-HC2 domain-containing protein [Chloroflexota bacterium]